MHSADEQQNLANRLAKLYSKENDKEFGSESTANLRNQLQKYEQKLQNMYKSTDKK